MGRCRVTSNTSKAALVPTLQVRGPLIPVGYVNMQHFAGESKRSWCVQLHLPAPGNHSSSHLALHFSSPGRRCRWRRILRQWPRRTFQCKWWSSASLLPPCQHPLPAHQWKGHWVWCRSAPEWRGPSLKGSDRTFSHDLCTAMIEVVIRSCIYPARRIRKWQIWLWEIWAPAHMVWAGHLLQRRRGRARREPGWPRSCRWWWCTGILHLCWAEREHVEKH